MASPNIVNISIIEFISKLKQCNDSEKTIVPFITPPNKRIKDHYTSVINKYICKNPQRINEYLKCVMQVFGNYDSSILTPQLLNNNVHNFIPKQFSIVESYEEDIKGYFVFKGGNTIKYWTLKNYTNAVSRILKTDIGDLLSSSVHYDDAVTNSYSDFDFSLYISNFPDKQTSFYKMLLLKIYEHSYILKNQLTQYFDINGVGELLQNLNNTDINCDIFTYFANNGYDKQIVVNSPTNTITNTVANKGELIIMRNINNIDIFKLKSANNKYINFSFNNTVKFTNVKKETIDFDLARLKVNFNCESNSKQEVFSGELFDLSIPKQEDSTRQHFCDNIKKNTNIIDYIYDGQVIYMRLYSISYLLKDLIGVLFIASSIFPWLDKKYEKRVDRLGLLYAQYAENLYKTSDKTAPLFLLSIYKLYSYFCISYKQNNLSINTILLFIREFIDLMDLNGYKTTDEMLESFLDARAILNDPNADINVILKKVTKNLDKGYYLGFMYVYLIIIIKKVYIDEDIIWCKNNLPVDFSFDIHVFKQELFKFSSRFIISLTSGILNLTQLPNYFDINQIMKGGDPTLVQINHTNTNFNKNNASINNTVKDDMKIRTNDEYIKDLVIKLNRISKLYVPDNNSAFNFHDLNSGISYNVVPNIIQETHLEQVSKQSVKLIKMMIGINLQDNSNESKLYANASMVNGKIKDYEDY
jgi:hypothetical protein